MIKRIFLFVTIIYGITSFAQGNKMEVLNKLIDEVKHKYAPDKRVAIFNISASDSTGVQTVSGDTNIEQAKIELINRIKEIGIDIKDEVQLLPHSKLKDKIYGVVTLSVANIRSNTEHSAELGTQALLGTPVKIYKYYDGFYLIQTPDNYISWVDDAGITPMTKAQLNEWINSEKIIYTNEYGFSYTEPNELSQRVSDLTAGNILINLGIENNFIKVKYPDGRIAYIQNSYCQNYSSWISKPEPTSEDIISTAKKFMGIPYLWGGTSAKGMDCSGFTKTVYFLNGIVLERDASQQVNTGLLVDTENDFENLAAGDLLFFGSQKTDSTKERVTHVGIYIGNLEFIHEAGRVKINSFDKNAHNFSEYRLTHFIRAKRILGSVDKNGITSVKNNKFYIGDF